MKSFLKTVHRIVSHIFFDPVLAIKRISSIPPFILDIHNYMKKYSPASMKFEIKNIYPCLDDKSEAAGTATGHYFFQDLWASKKIYLRRPSIHYDVGSRIDGFIAHLLVFLENVKYIDIRSIESTVENLYFIEGNICDLPLESNSVNSLSSLSVIEHIGLGRYGDSIDPEGHIKALNEFRRVLSPNGHLYISVPIGRERLEFNAHRVFSPQRIPEILSELELVEFSAINDDGFLFKDVKPADYQNAYYSTGLYHFVK